MKFLFIAAGLITVPLQASQLTAYVCDSCDNQEAQLLAESYAPAAQCEYTNPPGTVVKPDDMNCSAAPLELIVVNPVTEQAVKYRVQQNCTSMGCNPEVSLSKLRLTADERAVLATYYDIESSINDAVGQMNEMIEKSIRGDFSALKAGSEEQCSANPMDYFTKPDTKSDIDKAIAEKVKRNIGDRPWSQYMTISPMDPVGFRIDRGSAQLSFNEKHRTREVYERYFFGATPEQKNLNNLNFSVDYLGRISAQPGLSSWGIRLSVDRSTSWVDGYRLSNLTPDGGSVNLTDVISSMPCFRQFLSQQ